MYENVESNVSVQETLQKVLSEYLKGQRVLSDCSVPGIKWSSLRRVLLVHRDYHNEKCKTKKQNLRSEKRRAEASFWLENKVKWPSP